MAGKAFRINNSQIVSRTFVSVVVAFLFRRNMAFFLGFVGAAKINKRVLNL